MRNLFVCGILILAALASSCGKENGDEPKKPNPSTSTHYVKTIEWGYYDLDSNGNPEFYGADEFINFTLDNQKRMTKISGQYLDENDALNTGMEINIAYGKGTAVVTVSIEDEGTFTIDCETNDKGAITKATIEDEGIMLVEKYEYDADNRLVSATMGMEGDGESIPDIYKFLFEWEDGNIKYITADMMGEATTYEHIYTEENNPYNIDYAFSASWAELPIILSIVQMNDGIFGEPNRSLYVGCTDYEEDNFKYSFKDNGEVSLCYDDNGYALRFICF